LKKKVVSILLTLVLALSLCLVTAVPVVAQDAEVWVDDDADPEWYLDPANFLTIQEGVDAVAEGGTVHVAAGIYEPVSDYALSVVKIRDKSLTLLGAQADVPIVDGERAGDESIIRGKVYWSGKARTHTLVRIQHSDVVVNGFTIEKGKRGIAIQGISPDGISNILVSYNHIEGSWGVSDGIFRDDAAVDITITHNYIASNPRGIATRGGATTITDNTFYGNKIGIEFHHGDPTSMYFDDYAEPNYPTLISGNTFTNDRTSIKLSLRGHQSITVTGNDITEARTVAIQTSGWGEDLVNPAINYNNISDNEFGINNQVTKITLDAKHNWWGHASGPSGLGGRTNPDDVVIGKGDAVSDNVDWNPWLRRSVWTNPAGKDLPPGQH
jgi:hypothetical protein